MALIGEKNRENLAHYPEKDKRENTDRVRPEQPLLVQFQAVRPNGEAIFHETGKRGGERLPAYDHVPAHHEDPDKDEQCTDNHPPDGRAREEKQDERHQVAEAVLEDEDIEEILAVNDPAQDVP